MIGDGIEVRVGVRLGIVAPREVRVHRREIDNQIQEVILGGGSSPHVTPR